MTRTTTRILLAAALLPAAPLAAQVAITDHPESTGSNPYLPSADAPDYLTGWETIDQRFGLDGTLTGGNPSEALTQSFALDSEVALHSIFLSYNDSRAGGVIRVNLDIGNDGSADFTQDLTLPALTPGANATTPRTTPQHWIELDFSTENLTLPAGSNSFTIGGVSEEAGSTSFLFAPQYDTSLSFLVADFLGTREGRLEISITNLPAGDYFFRSRHLEPFTLASGLGFAQGATPTTPNTIEARLGGTLRASVQPTALGPPGLNTTFIDDSKIPTLGFLFTHDGASPLVIELSATESNGTDSFLSLNGFELFATP